MQPVDHGKPVAGRRAARVDGTEHHAVPQRLQCRARIRVVVSTDTQVDDCVRLLATHADDAARPVVLEASGDDTHAVCKQRRRDRVAGMPAQRPAIEPEVESRTAVDRGSAGIDAAWTAHRVIGSAPCTVCVAVSRSSSTQRRQPA